jgi:hypothetical protein
MVAGNSIVGGHWDLQSELGKPGIVYNEQILCKYFVTPPIAIF